MEFARSRETRTISDIRSFKEKLIDAFKKREGADFHFSAEQVEQRGKEIFVIEDGVRNAELENFLREYGVSGVSLERDRTIAFKDSQQENTKKVYILDVEHHFSVQRLPAGYAYKGGAARALLLRNLGIDSHYTPRDIDIVRLSEEEPYKGADHEIAERFMSDDCATGYGVEHEEDMSRYFATRDLTINEVLATDTKIWVTESCIRDTVRKIIRPTEFEKCNVSSSGALGPKMLSKILRFYAEAIHRWDEGAIEGVEDWQFEENFIRPFWLAIQLDRAFEVNQNIAEIFVSELKGKGQLPDDIADAEEAVKYLSSIMYGDSFYYRYAPMDQFTLEEEWFNEELTKLPSFRGHGRSRGDI